MTLGQALAFAGMVGIAYVALVALVVVAFRAVCNHVNLRVRW